MIITVSAPATKLCPYVDEVDEGRVALTFKIKDGQDEGPELHALAHRLALTSGQRVSHEVYTQALYHYYEAVGCVKVVSEWVTAGMEVRCVVPDGPC